MVLFEDDLQARQITTPRPPTWRHRERESTEAPGS